MAVKARLDGDTVDLAALARLFGQGADPEIGQDSDGYYLTSPELDGLFEDGGRLKAVASLLVRRANGIARASNLGFRPARLVGRFNDGARGHVVATTAGAEIRFTATATAAVNGVEPTSLPRGARYAQVAKTYPDVAEALAILGTDADQLNWRDHLYRVFEIIRHNVGGHDALITRGWKSREDISAFTVSANSPRVSGEAARHARFNDGVPKRTMSLDEGRSFINQLLLAWLDDLSRSA